MDALIPCFSSSTTRATSSLYGAHTQPIAYRGEAKEAVGLEPLAECHEHLKVQHANTVLGFRILLGGLPIGFLLIAIVMLRSYQSRLKPTQVMIEPAIMPAD